MGIKHAASLLAGLFLAGCTMIPNGHWLPAGKDTGLSQKHTVSAFTIMDLADFAEAATHMEATELATEMKRLQGRAAKSAVDRLKLAWLLSREGAGADDLSKAQDLLSRLDTAFAQPALRQHIRQMQRVVALELALRQERKKGTELQEKIDRLKNLELQLQERSHTRPESMR